jgi:hypothetical protein
VATKQLGGEAVSLNDLQGFLQTVREHPDQLEAIFGGWANEVNKLDNAFRDLLAAYAEDVARKLSTDPKRVRFVILIDDLDRCLPETTIAVLEGIKNFLAAEPALDPVEAEPNPSIFILALNPTVVYQGIQAKYKGSEVDGREYLEKILNYSFYVPEPELDRVKRFATGRLQELLPEEADQRRLKRHLETFGTVLEVCRFNNPRKIKRILNRYLLFLSRAEQTGDLAKMMPQNVARLLVLAEYYPALFNLFYGSQDPNHLGEHLGNMANAGAIKDYYGVELPASYPPLFKLKELFDLQKSGDNLERELKAVFELTRLV